MDRETLEAYCDGWLAAWHGRDPTRLLTYYADDCRYLDPAKPNGIEGKASLARYLARLMEAFSDMDWVRDEVWPIDGGFVVTYTAHVTVNGNPLQFRGMDLVLLDGAGRIARNEVYFDRSPWIQHMAAAPDGGAAARGS